MHFRCTSDGPFNPTGHLAPVSPTIANSEIMGNIHFNMPQPVWFNVPHSVYKQILSLYSETVDTNVNKSVPTGIGQNSSLNALFEITYVVQTTLQINNYTDVPKLLQMHKIKQNAIITLI